MSFRELFHTLKQKNSIILYENQQLDLGWNYSFIFLTVNLNYSTIMERYKSSTVCGEKKY